MSRPSNKEIRRQLLKRRNDHGWYKIGALRTGLCLWFSQEITGTPHVSPSAAAFYYDMKRQGRIHHHPRVGDIALFLGGRYGHAVVVTRVEGGVTVLSTDIRGAGSVRAVPIGEIQAKWGQRLVGYFTPPAYQGRAPHHHHHPHHK